uniref:C4b-binding protein alpha chain-like n=1 Tax=Podarcis muralis TaxID=64176 RepID=UPI0010A09F05|nr:C4b-binding protein alpha chain-like [Podarcis muralis]
MFIYKRFAVYGCKEGAVRVRDKTNTTSCIHGSWTPLSDPCHARTSPDTTELYIRNGRIIYGEKEYYNIGDEVTIQCDIGYILIGSPKINYIGGKQWLPNIPTCALIMCANPVVPDGIKLSGFRDSYTYGSSITFECKIGYFLIGSYFIRCEENGSWVPEVPSCKKIYPENCGAPVMPKGSVYPLQSEYKIGDTVTVYCHPNHSFFDETTKMTVKCIGYNQWEPSIQPCFSRTSPDTTELYIRNGRIIYGEKEYYNIGDEVTIQCDIGYILIGSPKINYIGGKQWLPNIPTCDLSVFLRLLIAASILPVLILTLKWAYKKCSQSRLPKENNVAHE